MRLIALAAAPLGLALSAVLIESACAKRSYQLPVQSPPTASAQGPDAGLPIPPPPSRRGVILPGDPGSGTAQLGPSSAGVEPHSGTSDTRAIPGSSDGNR